MPSIRDEFGRILDLRWSLARVRCASQPICALRVGPNRGKTPKSCPFKNEGIPESMDDSRARWIDFPPPGSYYKKRFDSLSHAGALNERRASLAGMLQSLRDEYVNDYLQT